MQGFSKIVSSEQKMLKFEDGGDKFILELKSTEKQQKIRDTQFMQDKLSLQEDHFDIIDIIMKKFNNSQTISKKNQP